jgi:hypothetical protein
MTSPSSETTAFPGGRPEARGTVSSASSQFEAYKYRIKRRIRKALAAKVRSLTHQLGMAVADEFAPIMTWPPVRNLENLEDLLSRLLWAVPEQKRGQKPIHVCVSPKMQGIRLEELQAPPYLRTSKPLPGEFLLRTATQSKQVSQASVVVLWKALSASNISFLWRQRKNVVVIDPQLDFLVELEGWSRFVDLTRSTESREALPRESKDNFRRFIKQHSGRSSVNLFGKGPKVTEIFRHRLDSDLNIVCNSIVRSPAMLEHIRPSAITCADAAHHFGPSRYAESFREDLIRAVTKYDCYLFIPSGAPQYFLAMRYPEIRGKLIGLEASPRRTIPSPEDPRVHPLPNILTWFMLPIALAVEPRCIGLWGFDGKDLGRERQHWIRESSVEYTDLEETVAKAHPAYFKNALLDDYYELHCKQLAEFVEFVEAMGVLVYSRTKSAIPALQNRWKDSQDT